MPHAHEGDGAAGGPGDGVIALDVEETRRCRSSELQAGRHQMFSIQGDVARAVLDDDPVTSTAAFTAEVMLG